MGLYDEITIKEINCPKCDEKIKYPTGQTKEFEDFRSFKTGDYFSRLLRWVGLLGSCPHCEQSIRYYIKIDSQGYITDEYHYGDLEEIDENNRFNSGISLSNQ